MKQFRITISAKGDSTNLDTATFEAEDVAHAAFTAGVYAALNMVDANPFTSSAAISDRLVDDTTLAVEEI